MMTGEWGIYDLQGVLPSAAWTPSYHHPTKVVERRPDGLCLMAGDDGSYWLSGPEQDGQPLRLRDRRRAFWLGRPTEDQMAGFISAWRAPPR